jgi:hypothetical protein
MKAKARFCKRLRRPGIDSEASIPPACVAWRAGTTNKARQAGYRFLGSLKGLQIRAQGRRWTEGCSDLDKNSNNKATVYPGLIATETRER